jgi:hypothetical protein
VARVRERPGVAILVGVLMAGGVAIAVAWGVRSLAVYAFFVGLAAAFAFASGLAGGVITDMSRGRFDRRDR